MTESNGRIKLSWAQIVWAIATIGAVIGAWADTRSQLSLIHQEIGLRVQQANDEHARLWKAIDEAKSSQVPKPKR